MRRFSGMVALGIGVVAVSACGGEEANRPAARAPATSTSRAALTTGSATTTGAIVGGPTVDSSSVAANGGTNAAMVTAATPPVSTSSAVMRITTAKCDREAACAGGASEPAPGERAECVNEVGHGVVGLMRADDCARGVDADRLSACLSEIEGSSCDAGRAVDGLAACRSERLCARSF